jgi:NTP pyrophosphatase (non-canonical NTP hydrolase)
MIDAERISLYERAVEIFGSEAQENMCIEECAELIQAINKKHRHLQSNIAEEIADVEIMLEQVKMINHCQEEVEKTKEEKLFRLSMIAEIGEMMRNDSNGTDRADLH